MSHRYESRSRSRKVLKALFLLAAMFPLGTVAEPASRFGNHFVVLLDDSRDMRRFRPQLQESLPDLVYGTDGDRPRFDPSRDILSVVFFTIHPDGAGEPECPKQRRYSAHPEHMFEFVEVDAARVRTKEGFARLLREWLARGCRYQGRLSPIATATSLVLPELARQLPADQRFARTFLVNANNGFFNSSAPPGYELRNFRRIQEDIDAGRKVDGTDEAQKELAAVAPLFRFASPGEWHRQYEIGARDPLYLNVFEAVPLAPTPEVLLSYPATVGLDRIALSPETLRVDSRIPGQAVLYIDLPDDTREGGRLEPVQLFWRIVSQAGEPWSLGRTALPQEEQVLDLTRCEICRKDEENGRLIVPVLRLPGELELSSHDDLPRDTGRLEFSVVFHYVAGKYEATFLETSPQTITLHPEPPVGVPSGAFFPAAVLDNATLAGLWRRSDAESPIGGLTQEVAKNRMLARRDRKQLLILIGSVLGFALLVVGVLYLLYRTAYHRPFAPVLEWQGAREVLIDFSRPSASRLLAGTLLVRNPTEVPWFGQRLGNEEQPTRNVRFELALPEFAELGLVVDDEQGAVVGFLSRTQGVAAEAAALMRHSEEPVSDGKRIHVFLASETVRDLVTGDGTASGDSETTLELGVRIAWRSGGHLRGGQRRVDQTVRFPLRVRPEAPAEPEVVFEAIRDDKLFYKEGKSVEIGRFLFRSRAGHRFALPYGGDYYLRASREHRPLGGDPIVLAEKRLLLPAKKACRVPAAIRCDGEIVTNPEPSVQSYELSLVGVMHSPESQPGPHQIVLHRDPARAEIDLRVTYQGEEHEIFWTPEGDPQYRLWQDGKAGSALPVPPKGFVFPRPFAFGFGDATPAPNVLRLQVGNTATSGRGWVKVNVAHRLVFAEHFDERLHTAAGYEANDIVELFDRGRPLGGDDKKKPHFQVKEGGAPQSRDLRLDPSRIEKIDGARIPADKCWVEVRLDVHVRDDQQHESNRAVNFYVPLGLEQLPGLNWLCIDFGTSAIAAAVGNCSESSFQMIRLQDIKLRGESGYGNEDRGNQEAETPFLPSWVICDGDQRLGEPKSSNLKGWPEGFPLRQPASQRPGEPSFLGLPALRSQLREKPGRIVFSLKSWLGKASHSIRLQEKVRFQNNGRETNSSLLPLDRVVESSFAALAEAYLKRDRLRADQVAICHPNTFTERHKTRLHRIAQRALMRRLDIAAPQHIALVSESDAVAFYYCTRRMEDDPRGGSERILVYDFGAGTLDLSIIRVEWQKNPFQPRTWTVEGRIGVPVAGNNFDEILARVIDRQLRRDEVLALDTLEYSFPLVGSKLPTDWDTRRKYRNSIYGAWEQIRRAKHGWRGRNPFLVKVGDTFAEDGPLTVDQYEDGSLPEGLPPGSRAGLCAMETNLLLSLPPEVIHRDARMAEFVEFVTETVVEEALFSAGVNASAIDTLLISGRGALWPGLKERLQSRFPAADKPDFLQDGIRMKEAVARGAIALQGLIFGAGQPASDRSRSRLGVLVGSSDLVLEKEWRSDRPIDLTGSPTFRLVQVGLSNPDPRKDMKTLRRHFYIDLNDQPYRRDVLWQRDPRLFIEKAENGDELTIFLRNSDGQEISAFGETVAPAAQPPRPPWPIGQVLLDPEE